MKGECRGDMGEEGRGGEGRRRGSVGETWERRGGEVKGR